MARFDPWTYPDRLSFEAYARRIRTEELGKTFDAIAAWLESRGRKLDIRFGRFVPAAFGHTHRHSPR
jgi:hypothetical protein